MCVVCNTLVEDVFSHQCVKTEMCTGTMNTLARDGCYLLGAGMVAGCRDGCYLLGAGMVAVCRQA